MDVTLLMAAFSVTLAMVWTILGCILCKKQPMNEAAHQKYFEKFRKRHILHADRILPSKVQLNSDALNNRTISLRTTVGDHTYEDIPAIYPVNNTDAVEPREHSFFDDSFQTVVEASSGFSTVCTSAGSEGECQFLCVPSMKASYLSLQPHHSTACLYTHTAAHTSDESQHTGQHLQTGEINSAYSTVSLDNDKVDPPMSSPHDDTYLIPRDGPKITITQSSINGGQSMAVKKYVITSPAKHSNIFKYDDQTVNHDHCVDINALFESKLQNDEMRYKNLKKLLMEGRSHYSEARRQSYDSSQAMYEQLKQHRLEDNTYKSLTSLVLPARSSKSSHGSSCGRPDHTYESLTAELSYELLRSDISDCCPVTPVTPTRGTTRTQDSPQPYTTYGEDRYADSQHDINTTPDHTYESVMSRRQTLSTTTPDLSVVIIGKRQYGVYDSFRGSTNSDNNTQDIKIHNAATEQTQPWSDHTERYSPFPSSKKLAIKSTFRPIISPRSPDIESISGRVPITPYHIPKCLDNLGLPSRRFSIENAESHTPEITFMDSKVFNSPQKRYFNPQTPTTTADRPDSFISPLCTYETLKHCINMKSKQHYTGRSLLPCKLPSISDRLAEELGQHCHMNEYSSSTPTWIS